MHVCMYVCMYVSIGIYGSALSLCFASWSVRFVLAVIARVCSGRAPLRQLAGCPWRGITSAGAERVKLHNLLMLRVSFGPDIVHRAVWQSCQHPCIWTIIGIPCIWKAHCDCATCFTLISTTYVLTIHKLGVIACLKHAIMCLFQVKLWNVSCWHTCYTILWLTMELTRITHTSDKLPINTHLRGTKGVPRKGVWTPINMRVWTCKELRVSNNQTSCYLRPPFLGTPSVPSRSESESAPSPPPARGPPP